MKKYNKHSSLIMAGVKSSVLTTLFAAALLSCGKSGNRPMPPQSPPKPQAAVPMNYGSDVQKAVFTYKNSPSIHYQDGFGREIPKLVIRT